MNVCLFDAQPEAAKLWYQLASSHNFRLSVHNSWKPGQTIAADSHLLILDQSAFGSTFGADVASICDHCHAQTLVVSSGSQLAIRPVVEMMRRGVFHVMEKPYSAHQLELLIVELKQVSEAVAASRQEYEILSKLFQTLTMREKSVLDCVLAGDSNKEAAQKLQVSVRTVESRRAKVYRKLELKHVAELVRKVDRLDHLNRVFVVDPDAAVTTRYVPRPYLYYLPLQSRPLDLQAC